MFKSIFSLFRNENRHTDKTELNDNLNKQQENVKVQEIIVRLNEIQWFSNCGKEYNCDLSLRVSQVFSWDEASSHCQNIIWENVQLEAKNLLTQWLHLNKNDQYQDWNKHIVSFKQSILPKLEKSWLEAQVELGLPDVVLTSMQWDILSVLMEQSYQATGHNTFFFTELLNIYEAGHFPCGWSGDWPSGKLLVF